jgi:hypothetical protein
VAPPIVNPPPPWTNQDIDLYHGTTDAHAASIVKGPIQSSLGRPYRDFGPGFYTTTLLWQARSWAAEVASTIRGALPAVVRLTVSRENLARLETLAFVRGDVDADDFWSLVHYCRAGARDHGRVRGYDPRGYYDVVYGPVAAFWNQRMAISGADQISFHTPAADSVLNSSPRKTIV